jgi:hypothetical protein
VRLDAVLARRLAVQRLTSAPFPDVVTAVRHLVGVQAQEHALSRYSLGQRTGLDEAAVLAQLDAGTVVRTHVLRPTWHYVAATDLRWLLDLTADKIVSGLAARHRGLGLTPEIRSRAERVIAGALDGGTHLTRRELTARLAAEGLPSGVQHVGHLLLLAELRGVICSGPVRGRTHTYALVDDVAPPTTPKDRGESVRELVLRFFAGHGPASDRDLVRWSTLTLGEIRPALADLVDAGVLARTTTADGTTLWGPPDVPPVRRGAPRAFLLQTFDEAYLTSPATNFPRVPGHPRGGAPVTYAETGSGVVVCDRHDVGWWVRKDDGRRVAVTLHLAESLDADRRAAVVQAAEDFAAFTGQTLDLRA